MAKDKPMQAKQSDRPPVRSPGADGLPHPRRDAEDSDDGAKPTAPKTAGAQEASESPLDSRVANRNAGRPRQAGATPRPIDKPLD
ncbi:hypothetical protein [Mesorhizobium sp. B2-1-3A]|uniref:hypothetical protein n=1 Tax=Mesorhizobium sp. B2-1-3A TaxID=2589971 RepID=UPI001127A61B|nr:hypothetical protein [Mesorhizobium sp. B2-1-3A]TPM96602.1 hypothetical protein FJ977_18585 [Mesorhizobium sp. B2-1-3A]